MRRNKVATVLLLLCLFFCNIPKFKAQDSISYTIDQAEAAFLNKNLLLLAYKSNIDKQSALIIQARAYPNPVFSANFNVYDPENDILFHNDQTGQKDFTFEQLVILGGKRKVSIEMAKENKQLAEAEFTDMLRRLKLQLHISFYSIYQYQKNISKYTRQLELLDTLIKSYDVQAAKGNISLKDVIRLKSVYLKVNNEKAENIQLLNSENKNIQILLQEQAVFVPDVKDELLESYSKQFSVEELETKALSLRPDLQINNSLLKLSELNHQLQAKTPIPDAVFNISTDQRGGAFTNQISAGVSIPLPLWNYNRGNIKAAKSDIAINSYMLDERKKEIKAEVFEAFQNMKRSIGEYEKAKSYYNSDFETVFKSVNQNFAKKNMTIIEFVDFFEGYNDALKEIERIRSQIAINAAQINFVTGFKFY
jgi:outer membrane protein, heavy metal efflux system